MTETSFVKLANAYLECKRRYKYAGWKWVEAPLGYELVYDNSASDPYATDTEFQKAFNNIKDNLTVMSGASSAISDIKNNIVEGAKEWYDGPKQTSFFGMPTYGIPNAVKNTYQNISNAVANNVSAPISRIVGDEGSRNILKQYFFSKIYADKYPEEYGRVADYYESKLPPEVKTIVSNMLDDPSVKSLVEQSRTISPALAKGPAYKIFDQLTLDMYNTANPKTPKTMQEWAPNANRLDFSRYAPGMAGVGLAPIALGALTGNLGLGILGGALLSGGLGYYGYNRIAHPESWGPSFIDDILGTADIGQTDAQIAKRKAEKEQKKNGRTETTPPPPAPTAPIVTGPPAKPVDMDPVIPSEE